MSTFSKTVRQCKAFAQESIREQWAPNYNKSAADPPPSRSGIMVRDTPGSLQLNL